MIKIIKFSATWCGPCKALSLIFNEVKSQMPDVVFQEIDIDQNSDLAIKYNVRGVPTIVIEKDNQEVTRKSGIIMNAALTQLINSYK
jgi:thioredoxin 1